MALLLQRPVCSGERVELAGVRDKGYAVSLGELQAGAWGLAAPVRDAEGRVIASVGVIALSELPETSTAAAVQEASQQISRALGALPTT
jgi:DNA-binding IclR family transcriptional regulator